MKVLIISPYGRDGNLARVGDSALNRFTRQLAHALSRRKIDVTVVAQNENGRRSVERDGAVRVYRAFRRGSIIAPWMILAQSAKISSDVVHFQHELFAYGGVPSGLMMPLVLGLLRIRRRIVTSIHGVIPLDRVDADFIRSNQIKGPRWAVIFGWKVLLRLIAAASDVIHVHEEEHKEWLVRQYGVRKPIVVVLHGMDAPQSRCSRSEAREALDLSDQDEVALFFGYLSSYKGVPELMSALKTLQTHRPRLKVVIAGAVPPRLRGTLDVNELVKLHNLDAARVLILGFVEEQEIPRVLAAADIMVLPYTVAMAASGPMALSLTHQVPLLLSTAFAGAYPGAPGLFAPTSSGISDAINAYFSDADLQHRVQGFCEALVEGRSWDVVAEKMKGVYALAMSVPVRSALPVPS